LCSLGLGQGVPPPMIANTPTRRVHRDREQHPEAAQRPGEPHRCISEPRATPAGQPPALHPAPGKDGPHRKRRVGAGSPGEGEDQDPDGSRGNPSGGGGSLLSLHPPRSDIRRPGRRAPALVAASSVPAPDEKAGQVARPLAGAGTRPSTLADPSRRPPRARRSQAPRDADRTPSLLRQAVGVRCGAGVT